ncbi:MAG: hypothetical protein HZC28_04865 [Spirochaetes bacterium]|nr:hypothetical protein [Spirochaetota bacterium]
MITGYLRIIFVFFILFYSVSAHDLFELIGQNGKVSVTLNEESNFDMKEGLPYTTFTIKTTANSHLVLKSDSAYIVIGENTELAHHDRMFRIDKGTVHVRSSTPTNTEFKCVVDRELYTISGRGFTIIKSNRTMIATVKNGAIIHVSGDLDLDYMLETYQQSSLSDGLSAPEEASAATLKTVANLDGIIDAKVNASIARDIRRYSFQVFKKTQYETTVFRVVHRKPGTNVFIFAPHADEQSAAIVAERFKDAVINNGSITIIPYPVKPAAAMLERLHIFDMNRAFKEKMPDKPNEIEQIAVRYKQMLKEYNIHLVLNMHEGLGWHVSERDKEDLGQTVVYDDKKFDATAKRAIDNINKRIEVKDFRMLPLYKPMPDTLTYYACKRGLDAFGIEVQREITLNKKILLQYAMAEEFLRIYQLK